MINGHLAVPLLQEHADVPPVVQPNPGDQEAEEAQDAVGLVAFSEGVRVDGQVGFAGSSSLGNQVMIGGQAGISGHLKIGNNVQIAGGSGVIKDIPNNSKVMGYPAKDLKSFIRQNK